MRHASPALDKPCQFPVGQVDRVGEDRPRAQAARPVVDIDVVERLGKEPRDLGDLATVLRHVRLPVRARCRGEGRGLAQHVGRARNGKPRRDGVAESTVGGPVPAFDQARALGQALVQDRGRIDGRVVGDPIHHHLADDRPDAVRLGSPERGVQARLVDRAVDESGGRADCREGPPGGRSHPFGSRLVEGPFQRKDVAIEPGQQVQAGTEARGRELRQVRMQVDQPWHQDPGSEVPGVGERLGRRIGGRRHGGDPPCGVDRDERVGLVARAAGGERRQEARPDGERGRARQVHAAKASRASRRPGHGTTRSTEAAGSSRGVARRAPARRQRFGASCAGAGQRFLPRTSIRWAVHSDPPRSIAAELPCHPQVQVIVCAWCLYSSITCLNGSFAMAGFSGGRLFNGVSCT